MVFSTSCRLGLLLSLGVASALAAQPGTPVPAERLTIRFQEGTFEVVSRTALLKVLPPSDELPADSIPSGFWYELRSEKGRLRYRKIIEDPCLIRYEGRAEGAGTTATLERRDIVRSAGTFSLLVPRATAGDQLLLVESPHEPERRNEPAVEVARLTVVPANN
jgi:hypothetical protein